mmetsp:Transcript_5960/g.26724  ORF Transcript_5960/g.26724 Transcript_5960/m.26724 type:complete len:307 (-) Transcript_5960:304-1224(-)
MFRLLSFSFLSTSRQVPCFFLRPYSYARAEASFFSHLNVELLFPFFSFLSSLTLPMQCTSCRDPSLPSSPRKETTDADRCMLPLRRPLPPRELEGPEVDPPSDSGADSPLFMSLSGAPAVSRCWSLMNSHASFVPCLETSGVGSGDGSRPPPASRDEASTASAKSFAPIASKSRSRENRLSPRALEPREPASLRLLLLTAPAAAAKGGGGGGRVDGSSSSSGRFFFSPRASCILGCTGESIASAPCSPRCTRPSSSDSFTASLPLSLPVSSSYAAASPVNCRRSSSTSCEVFETDPTCPAMLSRTA